MQTSRPLNRGRPRVCDLEAELRAARARIAELEAIVARLPVTADGVTMYHGMPVFSAGVDSPNSGAVLASWSVVAANVLAKAFLRAVRIAETYEGSPKDYERSRGAMQVAEMLREMIERIEEGAKP